MQGFYVSGGIYADTSFEILQVPEIHGPFETYQAAYDVWQAKARFNVDNACHRLTIVELLVENDLDASDLDGVGC